MKRYIRSLLALLASAMLLAGVGCAGWGEQTDQDEFGYSPAYEEEQIEERGEQIEEREGVQEDLDPYGEESGGWETEEGLEDDQM